MARVSSNEKPENKKRKVQTDEDVKRKAVKLVIAHMKKKVSKDFVGSKHINEWIEEIEELLKKPEFEYVEYVKKRKELNDAIERILDAEMRCKLRDSWYSLGRALDKKAKRH